LWKDRPHAKNPRKRGSILYELTTERIRITYGVLSKKVEETELTRIRDTKLKQSLGQRALGIGDVTILTTDRTTPIVKLEDISQPQNVKEMIRGAVRKEKEKRGIEYRETA
jgi:uncharacterized membrane protein YdbT with pleckstrin-like domain